MSHHHLDLAIELARTGRAPHAEHTLAAAEAHLDALRQAGAAIPAEVTAEAAAAVDAARTDWEQRASLRPERPALPTRDYPGHVSSADRRQQFGVGTDADEYELLDGAPVGSPEDYRGALRAAAARRRDAVQADAAARMATRAASWANRDEVYVPRAQRRAAAKAAHKAGGRRP